MPFPLRIPAVPLIRFSSRSKLRVSIFAALIWIVTFINPNHGLAGFAAGVSFTGGEEFNDNIFFEKKKDSDFITFLIPSFTLLYAPPFQTEPVLNATLTPVGQIFADHSDLSNFGKNLVFNGGYTYRYSPRLTFHFSDSLNKGDSTRTLAGGLPEQFLGTPLPITPTMFPPSGGFTPLPVLQTTGPLVTNGSHVSNFFDFRAAYLAAPRFTLTGGYSLGYTTLGSINGSEFDHSVGIRGIYNWRDHNLHAGYWITIVNAPSSGSSSNRQDGVIHHVDFGDDYFSRIKIQLNPTLTLSGTSGIGVNTTGSGPTIANSTSFTLVKLWQTATFTANLSRGLDAGIGFSGVGINTVVSSDFNMRFTERMSGTVAAQYNFFDSKHTDTKTVQAGAGVAYWFTNWLVSNFRYSYRWLDNSAKHSDTTDVKVGKFQSHDVALGLTIRFDAWPRLGLARGPASALPLQMGAPLYYSPPALPESSSPSTPSQPPPVTQ
jgi:hypothetical protein